jgi:hypothetical protein
LLSAKCAGTATTEANANTKSALSSKCHGQKQWIRLSKISMGEQ